MSNEKNVNEEVVEGEELAIEAEACDEIVDVEEQGSVFKRAIGFCKKHKAAAIGAGVGLFCIFIPFCQTITQNPIIQKHQ